MPRSSPAPMARRTPKPQPPNRCQDRFSQLRRRNPFGRASARTPRLRWSWLCASAFCQFLDVPERRGHVLLELAHPHEHDLLLFVRHPSDRKRQARARGAQLHPLRQFGPTVLGLQAKTPDGRRIGGVLDGPRQHPLRLALHYPPPGRPPPPPPPLSPPNEPPSAPRPQGTPQP